MALSEYTLENLVEEVQKALADGKITIFEIMRIVSGLMKLIQLFLKGKTIT